MLVDLDIYHDQIEDSLQIQMPDELQAEIKVLQVLGFEVQTALDFGKRPAKKIETVVHDNDIDLIAMTTHGRSGLRRVCAGSITEPVLHHVDVPILFVRPQKEMARIEHETRTPAEDQRTVMPLV